MTSPSPGIARGEPEGPRLPGDEGEEAVLPRQVVALGAHHLAVAEADGREPRAVLGDEDTRKARQVAHLQGARHAQDRDLALHARPLLLVEVRVALHHQLDADEQLAHRRLLGEEVVGAELEPVVALLVLVPARQEEQRRLADEAVGAHVPAELEAVGARHAHVRQDEEGVLLERDPQAVLAVRRLVHREALTLQQVAQEPPEERVVVHDQHVPERLGERVERRQPRRRLRQAGGILGLALGRQLRRGPEGCRRGRTRARLLRRGVAAGPARTAAAALQDARHLAHERLAREGLADVVDHAEAEGADALAEVLVPREEHHRQRGRRGVGLQRLQHRVAVHRRHGDVRQDEVGLLGPGQGRPRAWGRPKTRPCAPRTRGSPRAGSASLRRPR